MLQELFVAVWQDCTAFWLLVHNTGLLSKVWWYLGILATEQNLPAVLWILGMATLTLEVFKDSRLDFCRVTVLLLGRPCTLK